MPIPVSITSTYTPGSASIEDSVRPEPTGAPLTDEQELALRGWLRQQRGKRYHYGGVPRLAGRKLLGLQPNFEQRKVSPNDLLIYLDLLPALLGLT